MAPEQVRGAAADHRADLFVFGAILYEMLSGTEAFHRETSAETMTAILKEDLVDSPWAGRQIAPAVERIVDGVEKDQTNVFSQRLIWRLRSRAVPLDPARRARPPKWANECQEPRAQWLRAVGGLALVTLAATAGALAAARIWRPVESDARVYRASIVTSIDV